MLIIIYYNYYSFIIKEGDTYTFLRVNKRVN